MKSKRLYSRKRTMWSTSNNVKNSILKAKKGDKEKREDQVRENWETETGRWGKERQKVEFFFNRGDN